MQSTIRSIYGLITVFSMFSTNTSSAFTDCQKESVRKKLCFCAPCIRMLMCLYGAQCNQLYVPFWGIFDQFFTFSYQKTANRSILGVFYQKHWLHIKFYRHFYKISELNIQFYTFFYQKTENRLKKATAWLKRDHVKKDVMVGCIVKKSRSESILQASLCVVLTAHRRKIIKKLKK